MPKLIFFIFSLHQGNISVQKWPYYFYTYIVNAQMIGYSLMCNKEFEKVSMLISTRNKSF